MKWISVKDKLPEGAGNVLAYIPDLHDYNQGGCSVMGWVQDHWRDTYKGREFANVTHWMPLPEPPKEEE